jgi:hypothetical protein
VCTLLLLLLLLDVAQDSPPSSLAAFPIALDNPALSSNQQVLCTAACVCRDWREAVQQCCVRNTHVQLNLGRAGYEGGSSADVQSRLGSFASWLSKHSALVNSMTITHSATGWRGSSTETDADVHEAAAQLLLPAMQRAAAGCSVTATTMPAAIAKAAAASDAGQNGLQQQQHHQQQQQHQPGLRLDSFSSGVVWAIRLLDVLPAQYLTSLEVDLWGSREGHDAREQDAAALAAALPRLTNLRQLQFQVRADGGLGSCLPVIAQLSKLTCLTIDGDTGDAYCELALQQLLAQPLPLRELHISSDEQLLPVLDLGRLQQLQEFTARNLLPQGSVLPTQLRRLQLGHCQPSLHLAAVMPLQQLTALELEPFPYDVPSNEHRPLLQLTQLTALQQLRMSYLDVEIAAATASTWAKLPQLCELHCNKPASDTGANEQELAAIIAGLAAATSLTKLFLDVPVRRVSDAAEQETAASTAAGQIPGTPVDAYASIARLTRLQHLYMSCSGLLQSEGARPSTVVTPALVPGDAAALTALTDLTYLCLEHGGACVSDAAASATVCRLTQLRELHFGHCSLGGMSCLEGVAQLPYLRVLHLGVCPGLTQQRLMLLTGLSCLQKLGFHVNGDVTDAVVGAFQSALSAATGRGWQLENTGSRPGF